MTVQISTPKSANAVQVRSQEKQSYTDHYLTALYADIPAANKSYDAFFAQMATAMVEYGVQPIQEKVYGRREARADILSARERAYHAHEADPGLPVTFIEGTPTDGDDLVGAQLWGIESRSPQTARVSTVETPLDQPARRLDAAGCRMLYLPFVHGVEKNAEEPGSVTDQSARMFEIASEVLKDDGFTFHQVTRTWIYLARLLDWYGEFNRVRTAHFKKEGMSRDLGTNKFPASTGIQGASRNEECFMDVLAIDTGSAGKVSVDPITRTSRQDQAFCYGSAFSRGTTVTVEGERTVYVSGTASINGAGETVYYGDAEAQYVETLLSVAALLEDQGGSLNDICNATLFCKDLDAYKACQRVHRQLSLPAFPVVCVIADVCRHELLVEMEAIAIL